MCIELIAKIAHHILTDNIIQIGLPDAHASWHDGDDDHDTYIDKQPSEISFSNPIIENMLNHQCIDCTQYTDKYN